MVCHTPGTDDWSWEAGLPSINQVFALASAGTYNLAGIAPFSRHGSIQVWRTGDVKATSLGGQGYLTFAYAVRLASVEPWGVTALFAGGDEDVTYGALWTYDDRSGWRSLNVTGGSVRCIECGTDLCPYGFYVGGDFTHADGLAVPGFVYYDASNGGRFSIVGGWQRGSMS